MLGNVLGRASLNHVIGQMNLDPSTERTRKLAFQWGTHQARKEFTEFAKLISNTGKELKKNHGPIDIIGNLFDVVFIAVFGSLDAVYTATAKTIRGIAAAALHPAISISKSKVPFQPKPNYTSSSSQSNYSTQASDLSS